MQLGASWKTFSFDMRFNLLYTIFVGRVYIDMEDSDAVVRFINAATSCNAASKLALQLRQTQHSQDKKKFAYSVAAANKDQ